MGLMSWIIVGAIAGWLSGKVMKGRGFGLIGDILVGVAGGLFGGWAAPRFFDITDGMTGINAKSVLVAFLGAIVLLVAARLVQGRGHGHLLHR